jgi:hypothetical protein
MCNGCYAMVDPISSVLVRNSPNVTQYVTWLLCYKCADTFHTRTSRWRNDQKPHDRNEGDTKALLYPSEE